MKSYQYVWELLDRTQLTVPDPNKIPIKYSKLIEMKKWLERDLKRLKEFLEFIEPVKDVSVPVTVKTTFISRILKITVTDSEVIVETPIDVVSYVDHREGGDKLYGIFENVAKLYENTLKTIKDRLKNFEPALTAR